MVFELKESTRHHLREIVHKERLRKAKEHRLKRKKRKESGLPAGIPHTLESLRTVDETVVPKDDEDVTLEHESVCCFLFFICILG